jgi:hypothetical protein
VTALAAGVMTILFGVVARLPSAFAAGLDINSFLASSVVGSLTWPEAMGLVIVNGLIIVALAIAGLRKLIFDAVPMPLKLAITAHWSAPSPGAGQPTGTGGLGTAARQRFPGAAALGWLKGRSGGRDRDRVWADRTGN